MSTKNISLTDAKSKLPEFIRNVSEMFDRYIITKNGKDAAVLLSAEEYEGLIETLDILSSKSEIMAIKESRKQIQEGKKISLREVEKRLG